MEEEERERRMEDLVADTFVVAFQLNEEIEKSREEVIELTGTLFHSIPKGTDNVVCAGAVIQLALNIAHSLSESSDGTEDDMNRVMGIMSGAIGKIIATLGLVNQKVPGKRTQ